MDYMPYYQNMMPGLCNSPMAGYPVERLEDMYPDVYKRVYPAVKRKCEQMDIPSATGVYPHPTRDMVERMINEAYVEVGGESCYWGNQGYPRQDTRQPFGYGPYYAPYGYGYGYGGGRFVRDLVGVLLIRQLLGRRGIFYY